ncbi:cyclopropane-fatty-acyl-phospholipid synthase family protein [Spirillospora sp. NPDC047279]|uniref:cyclopropane-fatty-acyl-phospholipid synthase family protein n=1 Tax=Spirillospora sp. NPDC047279 TaxID=3155478 RepID=UPI003405B34F
MTTSQTGTETGRTTRTGRTGRPPGGVAGLLAPVLDALFDGRPPVRVKAWDGSVAGPGGAPVVVLRSADALRRILWRPGELGLARAYVTGDLDVEGDLLDGLRTVRAESRRARPSPAALAAAARVLLVLGAAGPPPAVPSAEARMTGGRSNGRTRSKAVVEHHYDFSNAFYGLILDGTMAYSCAYFKRPRMTLEEAQRAKLDLVCRKLGLKPGMRLLDVGCGWGSLSVHAAREYGAHVTGVTLSGEQAAFARERAAGLPVEIRLSDYRDIGDGPYDAVATIEMGEHVGRRGYPAFAAALRRLVRPGGHVLVQQMSRSGRSPGGGAFIERYIAPDMHMRPLGETVALLERAGLEVRDVQAMREHYVRTVDEWRDTFESRWDEVVAMVGEENARVWRLYLAGGGLAFEQGRMGVDQILAVRKE